MGPFNAQVRKHSDGSCLVYMCKPTTKTKILTRFINLTILRKLCIMIRILYQYNGREPIYSNVLYNTYRNRK